MSKDIQQYLVLKKHFGIMVRLVDNAIKSSSKFYDKERDLFEELLQKLQDLKTINTKRIALLNQIDNDLSLAGITGSFLRNSIKKEHIKNIEQIAVEIRTITGSIKK